MKSVAISISTLLCLFIGIVIVPTVFNPRLPEIPKLVHFHEPNGTFNLPGGQCLEVMFSPDIIGISCFNPQGSTTQIITNGESDSVTWPDKDGNFRIGGPCIPLITAHGEDINCEATNEPR